MEQRTMQWQQVKTSIFTWIQVMELDNQYQIDMWFINAFYDQISKSDTTATIIIGLSCNISEGTINCYQMSPCGCGGVLGFLWLLAQ